MDRNPACVPIFIQLIAALDSREEKKIVSDRSRVANQLKQESIAMETYQQNLKEVMWRETQRSGQVCVGGWLDDEQDEDEEESAPPLSTDLITLRHDH